jgi:hypothetical protein
MHNQPKFYPQRGTSFYADGRSVRPQVEHTVARSQLDASSYFFTGLVEGQEKDAMPFPVNMAVLARGEERYNINCVPCHSRVGNGAGMIVQRGYKPAGNFHDSKRTSEPISHYFYVITNGYGAMPELAEQVTPIDRWAIAAYIRALQLSQNAKLSDVPQGTPVRALDAIAKSEGLPADFAKPWPLPATAVNPQVYPNEGYPGGTPPMDPLNPPWAANRSPIGHGAGSPTGSPTSTRGGSTAPPEQPSLRDTLPASSAPTGTTDAQGAPR